MAEDKTRGVVIRSQEGEDFEAPSGTNHLLAIAIDKYEHCPVLSNCVNDVRGLIEVLKERYDFQDANIQTLINEEATRPNIHAYLKGLKDRVRPQDNVIIYFSGHGETEDNVGYWIPVEAHPAHEWEFVSTNDIKSRLDSINSFHTFVIVDACFSGALFSSYRSVKAGNENKRSRLGLAASHTKERALDGEGENSPFSSHLLKMLWENTGALSAHKLAGEIIDEVYAATKGKQTPVFKPLDVKGDDSGQYVFRLKADEGSDWEACQRVGTLATYEAFFAKYPEGKYIAEAQEKIAQLRDEEAWQTAKGLHTINAYLQYRKDKPDGQHREEALEAVQQVEEDQSWHQAQKKKTIFEYEQYLEKYPAGRYGQEARTALEALLGGHAPPKQAPVKQTPSPAPVQTKPQIVQEKPVPKPKEEKAIATTPNNNRKYLMIGGGVLLVVVLAVWGISSGKGKSAELAAAQDGQDTIQVSMQEGLNVATPEQTQSSSIQKPPTAEDPATKKSPGSLPAGKAAAASIGANGLSFDGKTYRIYPFKGLTWMAENLDFEVSGSWCYGGNTANCQKYGRLYSWGAAKKACSAMGSGWRLPTDKEWRSLSQQFGGADEDSSDGGAAAFKAMTAEGAGAFSAQLGGWRNAEGNFKHLANTGYYWSSTENDLGLIQLYTFSNGALSRLNNDPELGFSCRCVK